MLCLLSYCNIHGELSRVLKQLKLLHLFLIIVETIQLRLNIAQRYVSMNANSANHTDTESRTSSFWTFLLSCCFWVGGECEKRGSNTTRVILVASACERRHREDEFLLLLTQPRKRAPDPRRLFHFCFLMFVEVQKKPSVKQHGGLNPRVLAKENVFQV